MSLNLAYSRINHISYIDTCLICLAKETMSDGSSNAFSLQDMKAMMETMLRAKEQNFNRVLEAQKEQIMGEVKSLVNKPAETSLSTDPTGKGKEPIILDDSTPSKSVVMSDFKKKWADKIQEMERALKNIKLHDNQIDVDTLALFPEARLPQKFKMPQMDKFDGITCPKTHLKMYVGALNPLGVTNELLAQLFQQSLTGPALRWFVGMDNTKKASWDSICNAFNQ